MSRRVLRSWLLILSAVLLGGSPLARPGAAQEPVGGATDTVWQDPVLFVTAAAPGTLALTDTPGTTSGGPPFYCGWFSLVIGGQSVDAPHVPNPTVGDTYVFTCWATSPWVDPYPGYPVAAVYDPQAATPGPLVTTATAARFALDSITFERPATVTAPPNVHLVGVPSWFGLDSRLAYDPATAQAGPVWATVRPEFLDTTWEFPDGRRLVCRAATASEWTDDARSPSCAHLFTTADDTPITATVTARWTIWQRTDRTAGAWEVWGTVALPSSTSMTVVDVQAAID